MYQILMLIFSQITAMAWVFHIGIMVTLMSHVTGTTFGLSELVHTKPVLEGVLAVSLQVQMPMHLKLMIKESSTILKTITHQISYLSEFEVSAVENKIFKNRLAAINSTLIHLNITLYEGINHNKENRSRRALLDIGGQFLQGVFGVATDKDVKMINNRINKYNKKLEISQNKIMVFNDILKMSFLKMADAIIDQNKLLEKFQQEVGFKNNLMNTLSLVGESINLINVLMNEYHNLMITLRKGFLPENVISNQILQKIIIEGVNKFAGTKFPGDGDGVLSEMIKTITVHHTENSYKFILHIPFVSKDKFKIYNIVAVPVINNNDIFIASEISSYIGINNLYYFLEKNKLSCNAYYCNTKLYIRNIAMKSCTLDIVMNGTGQNCVVRKFETTQNYYIEQLQSFWVVVFFKTTSFVVSCGTEKSFKNGKGLFKIPLACTLEAESFILASAPMSNSNLEVKKEFTRFKILELDNTVNNTNISDHGYKSIKIIRERLTNIKLDTHKEIQKLKTENSEFRRKIYIHLGANYFSVAIIIFPLIAFGMLKKYQNNKRKKETEHKNIQIKRMLENVEKTGAI